MKKMIVPREQGSFMVEAIIGGALIAGLGMAGASFYKTRRQNAEYLEKLRELNSFHSALSKLMQNSSQCNATFKDWNGKDRVPGLASEDIKSIFVCGGNCSEHVLAKDVTRTTPALLTEAVSLPTDNTQWLPINISDLTRRQRSWQVRDIAVTRTLSRTGNTEIKIIYELYPGRPDAKRVLKTIPVSLKFSQTGTRTFVTCASGNESSLRSVLEEMCEAFNKTSSSSVMAAWNHSTQKCDFKPINPCTDLNATAFAGFSELGEITCQSYTKDVTSSKVIDNTTVDCHGGKVPVVDKGPDGRLMIVCN